LLCLLGFALLAPAAGAQDEGARIVTYGAQGYSVDASQINVVQVLTEVGQQAGFTVEAPDGFNYPVTMTLQDAPLEQLLRRVLRNENYIILYRGGVQKASISGEGIEKIFLLSTAPGGAAKPPGPAGTSPLAGPGAAGKPGPQARSGPQPPPPPPPGAPGEDLAARSARARAAADARRIATEGGPGGPPGAVPGVMPNAARIVQNPEDFTPPPIDEPEVPHGNAPVAEVPSTGEDPEE
jgi:hypothetical protein